MGREPLRCTTSSPVPHSNGLMIAYIPKEKIIFQGDFSINPGEPANDHVKALAPILVKLNLDYRPLYQRPRIGCSADQGGFHESPGQVRQLILRDT